MLYFHMLVCYGIMNRFRSQSYVFFVRGFGATHFLIPGGIFMKTTQSMYTTLFNGITDAKKQLADLMKFLDSLQEQTEQLYIEQENENN